MEKKIEVKLGSLDLQDLINERIDERINKMINEAKPEIMLNAIFENFGYKKVGKDKDCCIYTKDIKDFKIIFRFFLDNCQMDWSIPLPNGCITNDVNFNELNECIKLAVNDLKDLNREWRIQNEIG